MIKTRILRIFCFSKLSFAVVGSGPSGMYISKCVLNKYPDAIVHNFDKLFSPFGLLRYGVAPDH